MGVPGWVYWNNSMHMNDTAHLPCILSTSIFTMILWVLVALWVVRKGHLFKPGHLFGQVHDCMILCVVVGHQNRVSEVTRLLVYTNIDQKCIMLF